MHSRRNEGLSLRDRFGTGSIDSDRRSNLACESHDADRSPEALVQGTLSRQYWALLNLRAHLL